MNAITVNSFPSMNAFTSARGWFLALIVLLHVGFFWALSNGLLIGAVIQFTPPAIASFPKAEPRELPPPRKIDHAPVVEGVTIRPSEAPDLVIEDAPRAPVITAPPSDADVGAGGSSVPPAAAVEMEPEIDPRLGVTQPLYPSHSIRAGETGTVVLSVLVLENGRVGDVRIERSSGYPRLDDSAAREARRWRLKPGTRDGAPAAMWKQIPVTFRLRDAVKM